MDRRTFNTGLLSAAAMIGSGGAAAAGKTVFYQGVGDRLTQWDVDVDAPALMQRASITLPSNIQYAWPHPSRKSLYVTTSDAASGNAPNPGTVHRLCALRVDAGGGLAMLGEPAALPQRPIHNSVDISGNYAFTCYNNPSNLTVHRINADGTIGERVAQAAKLDVGIFAHQIMPAPSNNSVLLVTRGNKAEGGKPEDPGAIKIYGFRDGQLSPRANLPVGGRGGFGYGPRHLDFHRTQPWAFVSVESQNEIHMHRLEGDVLSAEPVYKKRATATGYDIAFPQAAGGIHIHPNGRTVYVSNRANATVEFNGKRVFRGGENNIAVFSIDPKTGEPVLIQNADTQSFHVRTFSIDPSGRMMIAASIAGIDVREGNDIRSAPAAMTIFRILDDGRLQFVRKLDVEVGNMFQWWCGFVDLA